MSPDDIARHVRHLLQRLDAFTQTPRYVCECGCLCIRGESCPNCKLLRVRKESA